MAISRPRALYLPSSRKSAFRSCLSVMATKTHVSYHRCEQPVNRKTQSGDSCESRRVSLSGGAAAKRRPCRGNRPVQVPAAVRERKKTGLELRRRDVDPACEEPMEIVRVGG